MDLKQITTNYNQLIHDHEISKQSNEQIIEQMESDNHRRSQYDKDIKQLQQQLDSSLTKEKHLLNEINQLRKDNERLNKELRMINVDYENIKTKVLDYEEQVEGLFYIKIQNFDFYRFVFFQLKVNFLFFIEHK